MTVPKGFNSHFQAGGLDSALFGNGDFTLLLNNIDEINITVKQTKRYAGKYPIPKLSETKPKIIGVKRMEV